MRKPLFYLVVPLLCISSLGYAQEKGVSGTIFSTDDNTPLAGVTVKVKGTSQSTETSAAGAFTVKAASGDVLLISHIGFNSLEYKIGASPTIFIKLTRSDNSLEEVVVAMDLKRNPRELGYSVQKVNGKDVAETQRDNFLNSLQGRIAGVTVTPSSGVPGSSSALVLRGYNSMSLSNQPLFVVDGIILDNSTADASSFASSRGNAQNADFTNRIADINPADIESITVLKGPEATVLYGSLASSGAIVITTRKPKAVKGKIKVSYDNSFRFQQLKKFPPGYSGYQNGTNGNVDLTKVFAFGAAYEPGTVLYDNVNNFFNTSLGQTHNLATEFGSQKSAFRISGSFYQQEGVVPNTKLTKYSLKITNTTKIGKYIDITPAVTYAHSVNNKVQRGSGSYLMALYLWPDNKDVRKYLNDSTGKKLFITSNGTDDPIDNPYFSVYRNPSKDYNDRITPSLAINIRPWKWLTIAGRFGFDAYNQNGYAYKDPQANGYTANKGILDNYYIKYSSYNHTISATAKKSVGKWNGRFTTGTRWNEWKRQNYAVYGTGDSLRIFDSVATDPATRTRLSMSKYGQWNKTQFGQVAVFGEMSINYKELVYLTTSMAFEAASVFPKANRNYSYPGGSLSIIMSDIFPLLRKTNLLNFWKLRGSLASTARLSDPYSNQSVFVDANTSSAVAYPYMYSFTNNNEDLKPERQKTYEIGTEFQLLNNRVSLDVAYYNTLCTDQIAQAFRASYATGGIQNTQNNSTIRNEGVEATLGITPFKKNNFSWNILFNFNHMWGKVLAIPEAIAVSGGDYYFSESWVMGVRNGLIQGGSTGSLTSLEQDRNNNGDILIDPGTGLPIVSTAVYKPHGDRSPSFGLSAINKFTYKTWGLSFLWDLRVGGDVYNGTSKYLTQYGKTQNTADRMVPRVIKGVLKDGNENSNHPTPNTISVIPYYNYAYYGSTSMPDENYIEHDINCIRLRDVSLTYSLPASLLRRIPSVSVLSFFVTCNDLLLFSNYSGADPEANGGNASLRGVGAIGMDYGNIGTPLSFNAGLRISLQ